MRKGLAPAQGRTRLLAAKKKPAAAFEPPTRKKVRASGAFRRIFVDMMAEGRYLFPSFFKHS
jgi:hypothetical protein